MNKICHKVPQSVVVTIIFKINEIDTPNGEIKPLSGLDPSISEEETRAQPIEELVPYHLGLKYPDMIVLLRSKLRLKIRVKLEQFIQ